MKRYLDFNDTSILTKFIKAIVSTTNIPSIDFWKPGKSIKSGAFYLTENYIVRCLTSDDGKPDANGKYKVTTIYDPRYFEMVTPYIFGKQYNGFTDKYTSKYQWYDEETHKYLGKYLRMLRDFKGVNLMHLYNCACLADYQSVRIHSEIKSDPETISKYGHAQVEYSLESLDKNINDGYKIFTCPIQYDQDYSIFINSQLPVKITAFYYTGIGHIPNEIKGGVIDIQSSKFNKPIKFRCNQDVADNTIDNVYRNLLTLLIEVPEKCNNVVVLEGDYSQATLKTLDNENSFTEVIIGDSSDLNALTNSDMDLLCPATSELTRAIDNKMHAFDLELIPYLLYHVIDVSDEISDNIARIQEYITSYEFFKIYGTRYIQRYKKGIWDNNMRLFIYNLMTKGIKRGGNVILKKKVINTTGYVDRDVEEILERGQNG